MRSPFRIGLLVPSSNTTMETELPELLRLRELAFPKETFTFHSSRMRMRTVSAEELSAMNDSTTRAAQELADLRPDVVATACLVAIMAQGPGFHCTTEDAIASVLSDEGADAPVVSSAGALVEALQSMGARRISLITPYMKPLTERVVEYIEAEGIAVQDALSLEVPDNRAVGALDARDLIGHYRKLSLRGCDALVVSACVQMPSLGAISAVERESGLPTLSAATATAWSILRALGLSPSVPNAGWALRQAAV